MYLQNPQHTASAPYSSTGLNSGNAKSLKELWSYNTGAVISAVARGGKRNGLHWSMEWLRVCAERHHGSLRLEDIPRHERSVAVRRNTRRGCHTGGLNTTLYVAGGGDYWYTLNALTGTIRLNVTIDNTSRGFENWASTLIVGNVAYQGFASFCDKPLVPAGITAINLTTGATLARFNTTQNGSTGASIWSTPVFDPQVNAVFAGTGQAGSPKTLNNSLYAESVLSLNATTLKLQGQFKVPKAQAIADGDFGSSPTLVTLPNGTQLVLDTNKNGLVYGLRAVNPDSPLWSTRITTVRSLASGAFGGGLYYVGGPKATWHGVNSSGALWALYPANDTVAWEHPGWGEVYGPPAYTNGLVTFGSGNGFFILNATTGKDLKTFKLGARPYGGPAYGYGTFYEPTSGGVLFAYGIPGISGDSRTQGSSSGPVGRLPAAWTSEDLNPLLALPRWA